MIKIYKEHQCSIIAVEEIPYTQIERYGVISGDLIDGTNNTYRVTNMIEKPNSNDLIGFVPDRVDLNNAPSFMAIIGRYILTPDIFEILKNIEPGKDGEIQITDAMSMMLAGGESFKGCIFKGTYLDCGTIDGYINSFNYIGHR